MLQLLIIHAVAALIAPLTFARWGRRVFLALAAAPASAVVWAITQSSAVLAGDYPEVRLAWVESIGLYADFRLDTLSWVMVLLVGGVGALVLTYCAVYFSATAQNLGRFAAVFVGFAGAMLGLVTTDNTLMLYVFWELTTVFSFLLIGHYHDKQNSRRAAIQAIILTTAGGLAMLGGIFALGVADGGSYSMSELVASPPEPSTLVSAGVVLLLVGAITKSALIPFHFWLPAAMAAPTPVSAYLHAAAMVKAGVYLVARLAPGFSDLAAWSAIVVILGAGTLLVGGYRALRQHDLKLLLAFGTVSQLGFIILLVGYGTRPVALAGLTMVVSHALFKASLFLVVGTIDWSVGTRDLRELSGLGRRMPFMATVAAAATASMIGLPPMLGYVAKEAAIEGLLHGGEVRDLVVLGAVVVGSMLTFGYGLRFWFGAFGSKPGVTPPETQRASRLILAPATVLAALSLIVGLLPSRLDTLLTPYADTVPGEGGYLTLWAGFGPAFWLTVVIIVGGVLLFLARRAIERAQAAVGRIPSADGAYRRSMRGVELVAANVTAVTQRGSLPAYLSTIFLVTVAFVGGLAVASAALPDHVRIADSPAQIGAVAVVAAAAFLAARARRRLKAVLLLGAVGYGVAVIYELQGAPDLALTQVLVETITLLIFILVLRRLPAYFSNRPLVASRYLRAAIGTAVGVLFAGIAMVAAGSRIHSPVSDSFAQGAYEFGYGRNIVNVTLVDIRAWDTMGEISVLLAAATGIASLIFVRSRVVRIDRTAQIVRGASKPRVWDTGEGDPAALLRRPDAEAESQSQDLRSPKRGRQWLVGGPTLAPQRRSVIFEIGTRMVFHTMLVFSVYLVFAGHNAPGGGFAGGLLAGIALTVRYLAGGRYELGEAAPVQAGWVMGVGLFLATGAGLLPVFFGGSILQSVKIELPFLSWLGDPYLVTTIVFDIGVFLVVVGLILDILRTLGAEVDRQAELEGEAPPDVAYDDPEPTPEDLPAQPATTSKGDER